MQRQRATHDTGNPNRTCRRRGQTHSTQRCSSVAESVGGGMWDGLQSRLSLWHPRKRSSHYFLTPACGEERLPHSKSLARTTGGAIMTYRLLGTACEGGLISFRSVLMRKIPP